MPLYEYNENGFKPISTTDYVSEGIRERQDLQRCLRDQIDVIDPDLLVISEEYGAWEDSRRRIDLLAVDKDANLVVIELKRTDDGGHMDLQAIRYAAMVSSLTFEKVVNTYALYLSDRGEVEDANQLLLDHLGWDEAEEDQFAQDVRIILVSANFSSEITTAVLWLNECGLNIECIRLQPYTDSSRTLVDVQRLIPLPEATEYMVKCKEKQQRERAVRKNRPTWTNVWFVNVGMDGTESRDWEKCRKFGFFSAGGGENYTDQMKKLSVGDTIAAYQRGKGYVGIGIVVKEVQPITEFYVDDNQKLHELIPELHRWVDEPDKWEHAVGIDWQNTVPVSEAKRFKGVFANQAIVCKLRDPATLKMLRNELGLEDSVENHL